jgi:hypothetical protein
MRKVLKVILRSLVGGLLGAVLGIIPGLATWVILSGVAQKNHPDWEIGVLLTSLVIAGIVIVLGAITGLVIAAANRPSAGPIIGAIVGVVGEIAFWSIFEGSEAPDIAITAIITGTLAGAVIGLAIKMAVGRGAPGWDGRR